MRAKCRSTQMSSTTPLPWIIWTWMLLLWPLCVQSMSGARIRELREETEQMFYHGFDNYMKHAFPEDELRPLTCGPLTRDRVNPGHIALNDVLGNYSLTLVDSLSTLAILSSSDSDSQSGTRAFKDFQNGVRDLVELYGDGSDGPRGRGTRGKGFELDSKVQVFETVIRGLGGLLSAHLFAVGDLPIRGYHPPKAQVEVAKRFDLADRPENQGGIRWDNGFIYNGQLLRLAKDLGTRLLPAFYTPTGLPYPRVNLRDGVPFYANSPLNGNKSQQSIPRDGSQDASFEITETCSAGAGSLVLEFTVLSRLTGDIHFEEAAKRAFWAVWSRRSDIGLVGNGIDADSGKWVSSFTGIGAGIDSFFEYSLKSHILLSEGQPIPSNKSGSTGPLDNHYGPLSEEQHSPESFLRTWEESQEAIKRHLYRGSSYQYPHYIQGDVLTGATRAFWIDSLSAYFPGLLTLGGDVDGAIEAHLLNTAVWTRFSALPERWNVATGHIDSGLGWWGGRPEFIESNYYLYRATKDPWYLYVGEMVLRDIKRRCWTKCGWAGLHDVLNGELSDRMESFFLGETAKYLYLLFEPNHPLNQLDSAFVFSTEGHPLIVPKSTTTQQGGGHRKESRSPQEAYNLSRSVCPAPPTSLPFGLSIIAARPDVFHAASLARLDLSPHRQNVESAIVEYAVDHPSVTLADLYSPSNYTFFPWTLPVELVPKDAMSAPISVRPTLDLSFPPLPNSIRSPASLKRVEDGVLVMSVSGLRLGMIQDISLTVDKSSPFTEGFRIQVINNVPLGKDEKVYISKETTNPLNPTDPHFTRMENSVMADVVLDVDPDSIAPSELSDFPSAINEDGDNEFEDDLISTVTKAPIFDELLADGTNMKLALSSLMNQVSSLLRDEGLGSKPKSSSRHRPAARIVIPAITSSGKGAVPLPDVEEAKVPLFSHSADSSSKQQLNRLPWSNIYFADEACDERLPHSIPRNNQVIVIKRGGCSFSDKIRNIPSFRPSRSSLQLVVIISYPNSDNGHPAESENSDSEGSPSNPVTDFQEPPLIRPFLDELQIVADGIPRPHPISMVMVGGGEETERHFRHAFGMGIRRRYEVRSQGIPIENLFVL